MERERGKGRERGRERGREGGKEGGRGGREGGREREITYRYIQCTTNRYILTSQCSDVYASSR